MKKQNCAVRCEHLLKFDSSHLATDEIELFTTAKIAAGWTLTLKPLTLWQPPLATVPPCHCNSPCWDQLSCPQGTLLSIISQKSNERKRFPARTRVISEH